jgi:hypothetical protein
MDTTQIVLVTLLLAVAASAFVLWFYRLAAMEDNVWIEPTVIVVLLLFAYLVTK